MRLALSLLLACTACSEPDQLARSLDDLRAVSERARTAGAYRCAPEELALAEAHLEFARHELDQGNPARAREHLVLARANASAALRLTDSACARPATPEAHEEARATEGAFATRSLGRASTTRDATTIKEDHASI